MIDHLAFLSAFADPKKHYRFNTIVDSHQGPPIPSDLSSLKEFNDRELTKLVPKIKLNAVDLNSSRDFFSLINGKSKKVLPNMIAHHIAINNMVRIEPHHHVFMKFPALTSESVRDVCLSIPKKRSWQYGTAHTIPVEALHHPNLKKEHAQEILDSASESKNPYINQMERQFSTRYEK